MRNYGRNKVAIVRNTAEMLYSELEQLELNRFNTVVDKEYYDGDLLYFY